MPEVTISPEEAAWVLYETGNGGYSPGSCYEYIVKAMMAADPATLEMFASSWPGLHAAVLVFKKWTSGVNFLQAIAIGPEGLPVTDIGRHVTRVDILHPDRST